MTNIKKCECGCGEILKNQKNKYIIGHSNKDPRIKEKKIKAYLERYGVSNPSKSKQIKEKKEETNLLKFGTKYASQNEDIKKDLKEKWIEKYGVDNPSKLDSVKKIISEKVKASRENVRKKTQETFYKNFFMKLVNTKRLGEIEVDFSFSDYNGVNKLYPFKCKICNNKFNSNIDDGKIPRCLNCNPKINSGGQSIMEKEIIDYIKGFNLNVIEQDRIFIKPLEIDILIPDKKIAIEFNGIYWHSEISGNKNKFYHRVKQELVEKNNYKLIQIYEDEWIYNKKIVKFRIKNNLGIIKRKIYARKCIIKEINQETKSKFLKKYHIQGNDKSTYHIGLFYKKRLISVMTFSPNRIALGNTKKQNEWELVRFCSIFSFSITGGASKLLSYFEKNKTPKKLISYADIRWSNGNLYKKLNFSLLGQTQPNYWYIVKNQRKHRYAYRKSELPKYLKTFDINLSEWENMQINGYDRIWDCGNLKFEKNYI